MRFLGIDTDEILAPLMNKVSTMSQQVSDLSSAVSALTTAVQSAIANENALKQKLDAAIADNLRLTQENTTLKQQLKDAQAGQSDPADATVIAATTKTIQQNTQSLADATAATSPSN